ncbi:MAG: GHKL domain-containing protein [Defluviitaleaceae bacterium]|nr:GHKL domain-containing protein [Defluviitaleaceae bacterium]
MIAARKFQPFYLPFLILPVGLLITTYSFAYSEITILWVIGIFISLASNMILLIYVVSLDKKAAIEEELTETRHTMELEQQHYRKLELHRKELTDIRHDFNNQLATIGQLIRSGEEHSAQDMIHSLSKEIMKTAENPFCNIPVINAILTEKAQACASADIDLTIELNLPDTLSVENIHLCSIFGNLLDNAINACKAAAYDTPPNIHLSTMMDGDYLFIKVTNPSQTPPAKPAPGRGYGSRILSDLSQRYDGDYWTEYKEGVFTAVVSLVGV